MIKILVGLLVLSSFSVSAKDCVMIAFENGKPSGPIVGRSSLKKCLKGAAVLLESNRNKSNPTVVVSHTDLEDELYIRLRDGLVIEN
jgi:hypothetical protein